MQKLAQIEKELLNDCKKEYPSFKQGDIIKVYFRIQEKGKMRVHPLEGIVIKVQGAMHRKAFTIRRKSYGQACEITFPLFSPNIEKIEVVKETRRTPRRARLYYLRERVGKKAMMT